MIIVVILIFVDSQTENDGCRSNSSIAIDSCGNIETVTGLLTIPSFSIQDEGTYACSSVYNDETIVKTCKVVIGSTNIIVIIII